MAQGYAITPKTHSLLLGVFRQCQPPLAHGRDESYADMRFISLQYHLSVADSHGEMPPFRADFADGIGRSDDGPRFKADFAR